MSRYRAIAPQRSAAAMASDVVEDALILLASGRNNIGGGERLRDLCDLI